MRIAIVGSGVSGVVTAHLLHEAHEVTVFEASSRIGGHVNTVRVEAERGLPPWRVDTGFIVYNETNYPRFTELLSRLGVGTQPTTMSFSVRCDRTGLEYNGSTLRQLFVQKRNLFRPAHYRMILDILRFNREALQAVTDGPRGMTLGECLQRGRFSAALAEHYLVPMGSALWSLPRRRVLEIPAEIFIRFFHNHGMLSVDERPQWRVVSGGSIQYLDALVRPFRHRIRTSTPVRRVRREPHRVLVDGEPFDQIVFACHSDEALRALEDPSPVEQIVLRALPFQDNRVVLHTDTSLLPRRRGAWGAWNYHIRGGDTDPVTTTYNMNILQSIDSSRTFCVTLNPPESLDPEAILYETRFSHPVHTLEGMAAQERHAEVSGLNRTHYAGAYWGFGFHEDGVRSAFRVAHALLGRQDDHRGASTPEPYGQA